MAVNTPAITAKAQPLVITIHPAPSALERFNNTFATTPSPSRISTSVPINSPKHFASMKGLLFSVLTPIELPNPVERAGDRSLPQVVHLLALSVLQIRLPGAINRPIRAKIFQVFEVANGQAGGVGRSERGSSVFRHGSNYRAVENVRLKLHQQFIGNHAA